MPHICYSSSTTVTTKCDRGARGMTSAEGASQGNNERVCVGGRGAAHAATPALPVEVQGGRPHRLCRFPTAANICDHGATRGTTSAEGGGGPPSPQYRRTPSTRGPSTPLCHSSSATAATERDRGARGTMSTGGGRGAARTASPRPSVDARAIDAATATPPWQRRRPNVTRGPSSTQCWWQSNSIAAPGERRARRGRGGRGAARAATSALPVEAREGHQNRLCHFPTAANIRNHGATRGMTSAGGGEGGGPAPQRG